MISSCLSVFLSLCQSLPISLSLFFSVSRSLLPISLYLSTYISNCLSVNLPVSPSLSTSIFISISISISFSLNPSIHLSTISIWKEAIMRNFEEKVEVDKVDRSNTKQLCKTSSKNGSAHEEILWDFHRIRSWQHQKRSNSARHPAKMIRAIFDLSSDQTALHRRFTKPTFRSSGATKLWRKHGVSWLFYLFAHLDCLSTYSLFSDSSHNCCCICP